MITKTKKPMTAEMVTVLKTVTSSMGTIDLDIPRDRKGEFEPQIVKKEPDRHFQY